MPEQAPSPVPEGMSTVTPHLWFNGNCRAAIDFYKTALGATWKDDPIPAPDGSGVWHVMLRIGDSNVMVSRMPRYPCGGARLGAIGPHDTAEEPSRATPDPSAISPQALGSPRHGKLRRAGEGMCTVV